MVRRGTNRSRSLTKLDPAKLPNNGILALRTTEENGLRALFAGFIDLYCETFPELRGKKNELRSQLVRLGIIPDFLFTDDLGPVRLVCSQLLSNLVRSVLSINDKSDFNGRPKEALPSRYRSDFEEIGIIGYGGFGLVFKVRSRLDKHEYAVKKIVARNDEQFSLKILHEVHILASLQHPNIVRYHCGWIEISNSSRDIPYTAPHSPRIRRDSPRIHIQELPDEEVYNDKVEVVDVVDEDSHDDSFMSTNSTEERAIVNISPKSKFWKQGNDDSSMSSLEKSCQDSKMVSIHSINDDIEDEETEKKLIGGDGDGSNGGEVALIPLNVHMTVYIQMELCTTNLEKFIGLRNELLIKQNVDTVDGNQAIDLFRQLISAIDYIHKKGLIHRDIKPGNLFLKSECDGTNMQLLLGDFGLSCMDNDCRIDVYDNSIPSHIHTIGVGTATYAAPEQLNNPSYDQSVDIYSSGIVLLELFCIVGTGSERLEVIRKLRENNEVPSSFEEQWPSIAELVKRMTSSDCERRPTAKKLLKELSIESIEVRSLREIIKNKDREIVSLRKQIKHLTKTLNDTTRSNKDTSS